MNGARGGNELGGGVSGGSVQARSIHGDVQLNVGGPARLPAPAQLPSAGFFADRQAEMAELRRITDDPPATGSARRWPARSRASWRAAKARVRRRRLGGAAPPLVEHVGVSGECDFDARSELTEFGSVVGKESFRTSPFEATNVWDVVFRGASLAGGSKAGQTVRTRTASGNG